MTTLTATRVQVQPQVRHVACRPLVWLWLSGIGQYGYRYILQVNDTRTSILYRETPWILSAIKYELLVTFAVYVLFRLWRRRWHTHAPSDKLRTLLWLTAASLLVFAAVLALRLVDSGGELDRDTWLCFAELMPWMATVFLVPLIVRRDHGVAETLRLFERAGFWMAWPFWLVTVILAALDIRYPALSHPGILLRFGGLLDDPNGYACLCLFWLVLALRERTGHWRLRATWYLVMLVGTVSLAGYGMAVIMGACWVILRLLLRPNRPDRLLKARFAIRTAMVSLLMIGGAFLAATLYSTEEAIDNLSRIYEAKSTSATIHLDQLAPDFNEIEEWTWVEVFTGKGGFSENFYWRVLVNLGLVGLAAVSLLLLTWFYQATWKNARWRASLGVWSVGVLVGSNGIAYLLVFPVSLIWWSALALAISGEAVERRPR